MTENLGYKRLVEHGIKPTLQRLAVINYLIEHRVHPTADTIFSDLFKTMPTLSRTTVYNTLNLLVESGAVLSLTIDDKNCRYDAGIEPHSHFMCYDCGELSDIPVAPPSVESESLKNCEITNTELYLYGYCPVCSEKREKTDIKI